MRIPSRGNRDPVSHRFDPRTPIHPIRSDPIRPTSYDESPHDRFRLTTIPFDRTEEDVIRAHTVGFSVTEK